MTRGVNLANGYQMTVATMSRDPGETAQARASSDRDARFPYLTRGRQRSGLPRSNVRRVVRTSQDARVSERSMKNGHRNVMSTS